MPDQQQQSSLSFDAKLYLKRLLELGALGGAIAIGPFLGKKVYDTLYAKKPHEAVLGQQVHPKFMENALIDGVPDEIVPLEDSYHVFSPRLAGVKLVARNTNHAASEAKFRAGYVRDVVRNRLLPASYEKMMQGYSQWDGVRKINRDALKDILRSTKPEKVQIPQRMKGATTGKMSLIRNPDVSDRIRSQRFYVRHYNRERAFENVEMPKTWKELLEKSIFDRNIKVQKFLYESTRSKRNISR